MENQDYIQGISEAIASRPDALGESKQRGRNLALYSLLTEGGVWKAPNGKFYQVQKGTKRLMTPPEDYANI